MPENKEKEVNTGAMLIQTETVFKCILEDKWYNLKDSRPYFVYVFETFAIVPGQMIGGRGQAMPQKIVRPVCEKCFKDPKNHFEMPKNIEEVDAPKPKTTITVPNIPSLRKN
jgi:hypothetical protein